MVPKGWSKYHISDLGDVQSGRQKSPHFTNGQLRPYLRVANVFDGYIDTSDVLSMRFTDSEYDTFQLKVGDILLNEGQSLELVGRSAIYQGKPANCCFQNTLVRFTPKEGTLSEYAQCLFQYLLYTGQFAAIASRTTSIAHLGASRFAGMVVPFPPLPEQRKIAAILSTWDRAIELTEKLIAAKQKRKQALMQQLLTGKVRFKEFVKSKNRQKTPIGDTPSDWKTHRLGKIVEKVKRKNPDGEVHVLTASGEHGLVDQREFFNRSVAGADLSGYYLLKRGEFAYNRSAMKGYPFGAIKRLDRYEQGVLSTLYICFGISDDRCDPDYLSQFFEACLLDKQLRGITQVGGRAHGLLNIMDGDFYSMTVTLPSVEEQRKIAAVLDAQDIEIQKHRKRLDALKQQKKGLMQQLLTGQIRVHTA